MPSQLPTKRPRVAVISARLPYSAPHICPHFRRISICVAWRGWSKSLWHGSRKRSQSRIFPVPQCDYLKAFDFAYEGTWKTYCRDPAAARAALGLDGAAAEAEIERILANSYHRSSARPASAARCTIPRRRRTCIGDGPMDAATGRGTAFRQCHFRKSLVDELPYQLGIKTRRKSILSLYRLPSVSVMNGCIRLTIIPGIAPAGRSTMICTNRRYYGDLEK